MSGAIAGFVGHGGGQVPARLALEGVDGGGVAVQVGLPLAGVAADETVEVIEAQAVRPLVEGAGLSRLVEGRVVVLAEPGGGVAVVLQDRPEGAGFLADHRVVAGETGGDFAHHTGAGHMVVAPGDQRRSRGRAERGGVEVGVTQARLGNPIQGRGRHHAAEGARCAKAAIVGHDQQHIGCAFGRHYAWCPPGGRVGGLLLDHPAESWLRRWQLLCIGGAGGVGRAQFTGDLLRAAGAGTERQDGR